MILDPSAIAETKANLRFEMKTRRRLMSEQEREQGSLRTCETLWQFFYGQHSNLISSPIAVYLARPDELSIDPLIARLLEARFTLCAPRVDLEKEEMNFYHLDNLNSISLGPWKIREPISNRSSSPRIVLLPALAYDANGHRLGMGRGWYDRTLARLEGHDESPLKIGVCFEAQLLPAVPTEPHDLLVDYLAIGNRWLICPK